MKLKQITSTHTTIEKVFSFGVFFCKLSLCALLGLVLINCNSQSASKTNASEKKSVEPAVKQETKATFLAVGDIMLSRGVNRAIEREKKSLLPFSQLTDLFNSTDFNFGNLESPISGDEKRTGHGLVFNTHMHDTVGLVKYNFKVLNLANNHALDQGLKGLRWTQKYLSQQKITYLGVGENKTEAWQPKVIVANGIRVGFIGASYTSINDGGVVRNEYIARVEDIEYLKASIKKLKEGSDFIIVTFHAGIEYKRHPNRSQIAFAHAAVDAGADLVIGTHPHWIQTFEPYHGKYIFYSLGNFIFDQRMRDTKEGLVLHITLLKNKLENSADFYTRLERIELIPIVIEKFSVPRRAIETEAEAILKKIGATEQIIMPAINEKTGT